MAGVCDGDREVWNYSKRRAYLLCIYTVYIQLF